MHGTKCYSVLKEEEEKLQKLVDMRHSQNRLGRVPKLKSVILMKVKINSVSPSLPCFPCNRAF